MNSHIIKGVELTTKKVIENDYQESAFTAFT
jgi:hypothetical protein